MAKPPLKTFLAAPLVLSLVLTAGCAGTSQPSRFYLLSTMPEADAKSYEMADEKGVAIGVGPVTVAEHLDRPQIIRRESRNKLDLSEFDRWAEPVQANLARVLALNLGHLLSTQRITTHPWPRSWHLDYQVIVYVWGFDSDQNGRVMLRAHWMVLDSTGRNIIAQRLADISQSAPAGDYEAIAAAQSQAVAELSRDIAKVIPAKKR